MRKRLNYRDSPVEWVSTPNLPFAGFVILDKSVNLSEVSIHLIYWVGQKVRLGFYV